MPGLLQNDNCRSVAFDPGDNPNPWGSSGVDTSDWDFGFFKAECNSNEYVAGVSRTCEREEAFALLLQPPPIGGSTQMLVLQFIVQQSWSD